MFGRSSDSDTINWKVYYDDGSTYDNQDGPPKEAPKQGVICTVNRDDEVGRQIINQYDFYWWHYEEEYWYGGDIFGLWDYLTQSGEKIVLFGRSVPRDQYRTIHQQAVNDPDFPKKSAWEEEENRLAVHVRED